MANRIQLRRGIKSKLPTSLMVGEPAYTTDTNELFVGTGSGNVNMGGSHWYTGTAMSASSGSNNSYAGCPLVKVGDMYSTHHTDTCTSVQQPAVVQVRNGHIAAALKVRPAIQAQKVTKASAARLVPLL